ncbi:hypothetical protein J21TS3_27740 [Paenibacillus cookii]|uniref:Uncharacterized protein n=1 Tax=Paenibacillus cookii TaxID=157839 RepID=A0ABQ4LYE8_9BACL|nr:hypothetical protein J21TS3_27740 [Paenibacillus cookii]
MEQHLRSAGRRRNVSRPESIAGGQPQMPRVSKLPGQLLQFRPGSPECNGFHPPLDQFCRNGRARAAGSS